MEELRVEGILKPQKQVSGRTKSYPGLLTQPLSYGSQTIVRLPLTGSPPFSDDCLPSLVNKFQGICFVELSVYSIFGTLWHLYANEPQGTCLLW